MADIPYMITGQEKLTDYISKNKKEVEEMVNHYGAVLLRGFKIYSLAEFQNASELICNELSDYVYRSSPRTKLGGKVYTSTEYPSNLEIPFHNENSYTLNWPKKILFHCVIEPKVGGETPIASGTQVYKNIDPAIVDLFEKQQVMYVRNYGLGMDLTWQEVFQTDLKSEVEKFCEAHLMSYEWLGENRLRTRQICQSVITHPINKQPVWFNQAHLFHESANQQELRDYFKNSAPDEIPRNTFFGNGEIISEEILENIREAYSKAAVVFPWYKGDLLILDNQLYAHGRRPFEGDRKIVVSMGG